MHKSFLQSQGQWNAGIISFISCSNVGHSTLNGSLLELHNWDVRLICMRKVQKNLLYCNLIHTLRFQLSYLPAGFSSYILKHPCSRDSLNSLFVKYLNNSLNDRNLSIAYIRLGSIQTGVSCLKIYIHIFAVKNSNNKLVLSWKDNFVYICWCLLAVHSLSFSLFATASPKKQKFSLRFDCNSSDPPSTLLCLHDIQLWVDSWGEFSLGNIPTFRPCSVSTGWQLVSVASAPARNIITRKEEKNII